MGECMLFPQLGPQYLDDRDKEIRARMEAFYSEAITINQSFWGEGLIDQEFLSGNQTTWNNYSGYYGNLPSQRSRQFSFNRILRVINMIHGHQINNRKSLVAVPIENGDAETADQFTKIFAHLAQHEGMLNTFSDAFRGSLTTGMSFLQLWMDYRTDPVNGTIRIDHRPFNYFLVDPYFKKQDMSDCTSIWLRSFLTKRECVSLLPNQSEEIMGLIGNDYGSGRDGKFQFTPESYNYSMKNLLTYDEYYYRDFRTQKILIDSQTGETMEWKSQDEDALRDFLQYQPTITVSEIQVPTVNLAVVIQGKTFYHGRNPMGIDSYPVIPVMCYYMPEVPDYPYRMQGVVRQLRDSQFLYNRRRIIELDILESQINSGWIAKESAMVNPKDAFLSGQGRVMFLKDDAQITDVQQIPAPGIQPSTIQLSELLAKEVTEISGISEELLGMASDEVAGVLSMLRQSAGLTSLAYIFDNLDKAMKSVGNVLIELIQANYTSGKVQKILSGDQPAPQFYNKAFGRYGCTVEEGLNTTTQKQMELAQLMELRKLGINIPDTAFLEAAQITNKKKLLESMQAQQEQQSQIQQQQAQLQMAELEAKINLANARAQADQGLGLERISRVQENKALAVERRAKAVHEEETGFLDLVKALKEIDDIDLAQVEKMITLSNVIKANTAQGVPEQEARGNTP